MRIRARNEKVELVCEHCGATEVLKDGLAPTGFMRRWNAFKRKHQWRCAAEAKSLRARQIAINETNSLVHRLVQPATPKGADNAYQD